MKPKDPTYAPLELVEAAKQVEPADADRERLDWLAREILLAALRTTSGRSPKRREGSRVCTGVVRDS
jgi:hypothetical protein